MIPLDLFIKRISECNIDLGKDIKILLPEIPTLVPAEVAVNLFQVLSNLTAEAYIHTNYTHGRIRFPIEHESGRAIEFAWDEGQLDEQLINQLNTNYEQGRTLKKRPVRNGTFIAGYYAGKIGAKITIENINDQVYNVRNLVFIPVL